MSNSLKPKRQKAHQTFEGYTLVERFFVIKSYWNGNTRGVPNITVKQALDTLRELIESPKGCETLRQQAKVLMDDIVGNNKDPKNCGAVDPTGLVGIKARMTIVDGVVTNIERVL